MQSGRTDAGLRSGDWRSLHTRSWGRWLVIALLLVLPLLLRFADLEADPPLNVAFIHAFATDEGFYSYHARHVTLFGETPPAAFWDNQQVSPLFDLVVRASFSCFGPGFRALRFPQSLLGIATVGLLYVLLRQQAGPKAALWGALFLAWNHVFLVFNRVGMYHTLMTLLCTACAYAWLRARGRPGWLLLSGALAALALLTSLFSLLFLTGLAVAGLLLALSQRRLRLSGLLSWLAGLAIVLVPVTVLWALPQWDIVQRNLSRSSAVLPLYTNPVQTLANPFLFLYAPVFLLNLLPLLGVCLFTGATLFQCRRGRRLEALDALLLGWFWSGALVLALVNYRPTRYCLYLLVPMCAALALVVMRWSALADLPPKVFLWPAIPLIAIAGLALRDRLGPQRFSGDALWWAGAALSWGVAILPNFFQWGKARRALPHLGIALASCCLLVNAAFSLSVWQNRAHTLPQASREVGQTLPRNALILQGCTLSLETQFRCLPIVSPDELGHPDLAGYRLFYLSDQPDGGLPGDRRWGTWPVLDAVIHLYELSPGQDWESLNMIQF